MPSISILAPYLKETKKGLVLSGTKQQALQALFRDDVTTCFGKRVQLEPTPMHVAGRELVVVRIKAAPASNGTGPKTPAGEKAKVDAPAADNGAEPHPEAAASNQRAFTQ